MESPFVPIGKLYFGKLDAYSECLEYGMEMYQSLFYACPNFHVEKFLEGKAYYIHGDKGVGKTALLKHIEIIAIEKNALVEYIRFKKDINDEDRNTIKRAGIPNNSFEEVLDKDIPNNLGINCVTAWQVYIIKCIVNQILESKSNFFEENSDWKKLKCLIKTAYKNTDSPIKKILPKIKHGNLKLEISDIVELGADFEWENSEARTVSFSTYAKRVIDLFSKLKKTERGLCSYILFDELELIHLQKKTYQRDTALIRDLIQAIYYINEISKESKFQIYTIACFRNEVYRSVAAIGFEINKFVQDYGVEISWQQSGGSISDNPLIKMLTNRLINSQPQTSAAVTEQEIWQAYFDDYVNINYPSQSSRNYVVDQTWSKPRDIIRLFNLIQKKFENSQKIGISCFESVRKAYSQESWEEFRNELSAKYTPLEIDGIKQVLIGIGPIFSLDFFTERLMEKASYFKSVKILQEKHQPIEILEDIYRVGVIGTDGRWKRFYFKGDEDFDCTANFVIHYPLRRFFSS